MDSGRIIEMGRFDELALSNGRFAALLRAGGLLNDEEVRRISPHLRGRRGARLLQSLSGSRQTDRSPCRLRSRQGRGSSTAASCVSSVASSPSELSLAEPPAQKTRTQTFTAELRRLFQQQTARRDGPMQPRRVMTLRSMIGTGDQPRRSVAVRAAKARRAREVARQASTSVGRPFDRQHDPLAFEHGERAVDTGKQRERAVAGDRRHAEAPFEVVEPGAFRKDSDLGRHAAAVLPRHAAVVGRAQDAHQPRMPGRLSWCSCAHRCAMS